MKCSLKKRWRYKNSARSYIIDSPFLTLNLSSIDNYLPMIIYFSPRESYWGKVPFRVDRIPSSRWAMENELNGIFRASLSHNFVSGLIFFIFSIFNILKYVCNFCTYWDVQFCDFMRSLSVQMSEFLHFYPFFALFSWAVFLSSVMS